jgi:hypothetical protein
MPVCAKTTSQEDAMNLSRVDSAVFRIAVCLLLAGILFLPGLAWAQRGTVGQSAGQDAAPLATGAGILKKAAFFSLNNTLSNANPAVFLDVFNVSVTTAGAVQCVLVQYSGEIALTGAPEAGISGSFRTLLDGVLMEGHGVNLQNYVSPDGNATGRFEIVGFHHWKCDVPPGAHTIQVQIEPEATGVVMFVRARSLTVQFKK